MPSTRRRALRGAAGLATVLAGCGSDTEDHPPADERTTGRPANVAVDPPTHALRQTGSGEPIVEVSDGDGGGTEGPAGAAAERGFLTSAEAASLLRVHDGVDGAEQFLADTDFDSQFVYVDRRSVRQCFELSLCHVTWTEFELSATYARRYRDYDVACRTDARDRVARFVRLDGSVGPEQIESGATRVHTGRCPVPRWRRGDETTTGPSAASVRPGGGYRG